MNRKTRYVTGALITLCTASMLPLTATATLEPDAGLVTRVQLSLNEAGLKKTCDQDFVVTLHKNGFSVTDDPERIDGVLFVDVKGVDRAIGLGADFTAELRGKGDEVLWRMHGRKNSLTASNLCEDVADSVVHHLEDFKDNLNHVH